MCDEDQTYTERARGWLKEHEPTPDQIQGAYTKMLALVDSKPHLAGGDTDECLELLVCAYGAAGGSLDDLLSQIEAKKSSVSACATVDAPILDSSPLYTVSDGPAVSLEPDVKRAAFLQLKAQIQRDAGYKSQERPF